MKSLSPLIIVGLAEVVGIIVLGQYYRAERMAGRGRQMFLQREREGRWGSVLIMMGAVLFAVLGNEQQWFQLREGYGWLIAAGGILGIGIVSESLAWLLGFVLPPTKD